jgi:S-adenosylmethionine synthetase
VSSNTTFMTSPKFFFTSESVTEGHPDKICDQISDSVLDAIVKDDPNARVACETAVTTGLVLVMGEITTSTYVDIAEIARETIRDIGYTRAKYGFDADTCGVIVSIKEQSGDIAMGVDKALEAKEGQMSDEEIEAIGAGDQGMMIGFACNETPEYMPLTSSLANKLSRQLSNVRRNGLLDYLRPDGKSQVTVEYEYGKPKRIDAIVISTQHSPDVTREQIRADIIEHVIHKVVPLELVDDNTRIYVNPTGRFVVGGPMGDAGVTGRKIIVDTYGGVARHGGGAFSGKDATKVDRSAAYMARYICKNIVAAGLAERVELQVSYAIGVARPTSLAVETFGTGKVSDAKIEELVARHFDMRPAAIIRDLELRNPVFRQVAAFGHFGRDDLDLTWERTDKADILRQEAGL